MASIVFEGVEKRYPDGYAAIQHLDLTIEDGEFLVLVGPSGCGKSTALRMIAGLEEITGGRLLIGDTLANGLAPRDRDIAMVFQSYALYPHMTVAENIGFGLSVRGTDKAEIDRKVKETAKLLELDAYLHRKPGQLSGGQRQRVAMGRALVRAPKAFLMDEPLSNLDARLRGQMRAEIARLQKLSGITTVYVTHDQIEAMTMGDRVAVMRAGVLQQLGTPRALYDTPANLFVAGFIGTPAMNFLKARLERGEAGLAAVAAGFSLPVPDTVVAARPELSRHVGKEIIVGVRAEALGVVDAEAGHGRIGGTIAFIEDFGATKLVHLDIGGAGKLEEVAAEADEVSLSGPRLRASIPATHPLRLGETLSLSVDPAQLHFFDVESENAIRD
jgi:multiple sugar transport system ATP-binding protein